MTNRIFRAAAAVSFSYLAFASGAANASLMTFTSEELFLSAVTGAVTDTYNDLVAGVDGGLTLFDPLSRTVSTGSYELTLTDGPFFVGADSLAPSGEEYISNNDINEDMFVSSFVGLPTGAIGGFLFGSDTFPVTAIVTATAFDLDGASASISLDCDLLPANCFFGFTSTVGIERLELESDTTQYFGLDDLTFANLTPAPRAVVSAPGTVALLGFGLLALRLRRRF